MNNSSGWVDDFDSFKGSQTEAPEVGGGKSPKKKAFMKVLTKKDKIENELKLLEWHKMANDAALKAALIQTKSMQEPQFQFGSTSPLKGKTSGAAYHDDDSKWIKKVIQDENSKPLEVSRDFVLDYERRELQNQERLSSQVDRHISTLHNLKSKLESKVEMKSRTNEYRSWKHSNDYMDKKEAIRQGKTISDYQAIKQQKGPKTPKSPADSRPRGEVPGAKKHRQEELNNVLDSLNRLSELEKRISSLETTGGNRHDASVAREKSGALPAGKTTFTKKRGVDSFPNPNSKNGKLMSVKYAVHNKQNTGGKLPAIKSKTGGGGGTFLTGQEDEEDDWNKPQTINDPKSQREKARVEQRMAQKRANYLATPGQKQLQNRLGAKRNRGNEIAAGNDRHESAMKELQRRKLQQQRPGNKAAPVAAPRGAAGGARTKNKYMNEFQQAKKGFTKKRELAAKPAAPPAPSRRLLGKPHGTGTSTKLPSLQQRLGSRTAPPAARGQPQTQSSGTVTRRVQGMPSRRAPAAGGRGGAQPVSAPSLPAVGVSGVRALAQQKKR